MTSAGRIAWPAAILGPSAVALALVPVRGDIDPTNVALIMVVVVVAVAALGQRLPGLVAAVVAGLAFDYLWTQLYHTFTIEDPSLIQTAVLLVVVGAAVSELAWLGQHARQQSAQDRGYLAGGVDLIATFEGQPDADAQCGRSSSWWLTSSEWIAVATTPLRSPPRKPPQSRLLAEARPTATCQSPRPPGGVGRLRNNDRLSS